MPDLHKTETPVMAASQEGKSGYVIVTAMARILLEELADVFVVPTASIESENDAPRN